MLVWCVCILFTPLSADESVKTLVEGVTGKALENVQEVLVLPHGLVRDGNVDRLSLECFARQAEGQVRTALEPFGYYSPEVTITIEKQGSAETLLRVHIELGNPMRVDDVQVSMTGPGAMESALKELVAAFPLRKSDVLLQQDYDQSRDALKARAKQLGYMKAEFTTHEIRVTKSTASAMIKLTLDTGRKYYFQDVTFSGAPNYPGSFLRLYLEFKPGDVFSYAKLGESHINLTNSERFKDVVLTPTIPESDDDKVPVNV
jgi:translocation and assembly module TamA